jgi:hypothetical protein
MNFIDSIIRIINAPRVIEQQSVLIDKLNQQIEKMNMDINLLDSSIEDFKKALYNGEFVGAEYVETRLSQKMDQVRHELSEHDHDGEFALEDHDHGDDLARADHGHDGDLAREDHDHDLSDDVARIVRNKLIEAFEEIASNI